MAAMVAGPMMDLKKEEKPKMYPEEWWWAERQVSEVLAEHPGELVKTGEKKRMWRRRAVSQRDLGLTQALLIYQNPQKRQSSRGFYPKGILDASLSFQTFFSQKRSTL